MGAKNQALARDAARQYEWQLLTSLNEAEIIEVLQAAALAAPRVSVGTGSMTMESHQRAADGFVMVWAHRALARNVDGASRTRVSLPPCLLYTSPSPRDGLLSRMPSSA